MNSYHNLTVITGASQGLGNAFAKTCAAEGRDLVLISLPNEGLPETAREIEENFGVQVKCFETDLTRMANIKALVKELSSFRINMLINNAGLGGTKKFQDASADYIENIILLNIRCLVMMTHQLLPFFDKDQQTYILNIASLAAFSPMPYKTVYPASKAFVMSFSRGLYGELKDTNIHVAVSCPGGLATNSEVANRISTHNSFVKKSILTPQEVAEKSYRQLLKKKYLIIPGRINHLSSLLQRIVPVRFQLGIIANNLQKEILTYPSV
ncbi:SDR family NAD(P)-dependent oxidoreductase [Salinimicrobium soli]|uniref:SDR family NAD(P)-dependent oxidoreductase n=1 Tax=Salinimicrobium soli TaxID=1254399 RepID=UPI003AABEDB3